MKKLEFNKTSDGRWYVNLPDWKGSKSDLEMVSGADSMLDYMVDDYDNRVFLSVSETDFKGSDILEFVREADEIGNGSFYILNKYKGIDLNLEIWLCDVLKFVFGYFPGRIYIKVI